MCYEYGVLNTVDPDRHKIIPGNHDNIDDLLKWPHCLGDYGFTTLGGISFFFVRGEFSITVFCDAVKLLDKPMRRI